MNTNGSSNEKNELYKLIKQYEEAKAIGKMIYMDSDQLAEIADEYALLQRTDKAQEVINYGLQLHPGNTELLISQAFVYLDKQEIAKAKEIAENISDQYDIEVLLLKAEILLKEGKLEAAEAVFKHVEQGEEFMAENIIDIFYLFLDMGYPAAAKKWLDKTEKLEMDELDLITAKAKYLLANQEFDSAIQLFNKLIDTDAFNATYWVDLAKCHFAADDAEKTIEACDFALAIDDTCGEAYLYKAHSFFYLSNADATIENYTKAIEYKVFPPEMGYLFIGMAYAIKEDWLPCIEFCDKVIQLYNESDNPLSFMILETYNTKLSGLLGIEQYDKAHAVCQELKKIDPTQAATYISEGRIHLALHNREKAIQSFNKAEALNDGLDNLLNIASIYQEEELFENAKECLERIHNTDPYYEDVLERLCYLSIKTRDRNSFIRHNQELKNPFMIDDIRQMMTLSTDVNNAEVIFLADIIEKMRFEKRKEEWLQDEKKRRMGKNGE